MTQTPPAALGRITLSQIYVAPSALHGRGVFASDPFAAGSVIEVCPTLIVPAAERPHLDQTVLYNHYYEWGGSAGLALGFGSLYNHSYSPNATYRQDLEEGLLYVTALRPIAPDEEITINYNGNPTDQRPVWYEDDGSRRRAPADD